MEGLCAQKLLPRESDELGLLLSGDGNSPTQTSTAIPRVRQTHVTGRGGFYPPISLPYTPFIPPCPVSVHACSSDPHFSLMSAVLGQPPRMVLCELRLEHYPLLPILCRMWHTAGTECDWINASPLLPSEGPN